MALYIHLCLYGLGFVIKSWRDTIVRKVAGNVRFRLHLDSSSLALLAREHITDR